uniref:Uncharacterized protein n=1 Tax=Chromera velia CCMP2878 TaxID=1169474 RepID=A0A0G4FMA7_9ALVE|eukprot:Cvel_3485.t1-p1 / transcript=Cvel_3485.t1 / gene=Cvel_3485 / organism=Chromera_velia_CCMP2878 / gene_product=hypothetical protein / transcript_product=hypothetical protein / location=Cvel_scaffold140:118878-123160(+) / protein_length=246 / sequence_SO=supercontig / SO=protein_coding / is_pseudo=false
MSSYSRDTTQVEGFSSFLTLPPLARTAAVGGILSRPHQGGQCNPQQGPRAGPLSGLHEPFDVCKDIPPIQEDSCHRSQAGIRAKNERLGEIGVDKHICCGKVTDQAVDRPLELRRTDREAHREPLVLELPPLSIKGKLWSFGLGGRYGGVLFRDHHLQRLRLLGQRRWEGSNSLRGTVRGDTHTIVPSGMGVPSGILMFRVEIDVGEKCFSLRYDWGHSGRLTLPLEGRRISVFAGPREFGWLLRP